MVRPETNLAVAEIGLERQFVVAVGCVARRRTPVLAMAVVARKD